MTRRLKLMTSLSTIAAVGALALAGCGGEGEAESEGAEGDATSSISGEGMSAEGESEGAPVAAGEGDEGGAAAMRTGDPATDDVEYIRLLGLVRGHLTAFVELYQGGATEMALMHVKHPESELYQNLVPAFEARRTTGFSDQLTALSDAANAGGDISESYSAVSEAISMQMPAASIKNTLLAISEIVRTAAEEFDMGVEDDGTISKPHEYQDAYGFLVAAREMLSGLHTDDMNEGDAIAMAHEQIETSLASFDGLTVTQTEGRPSTLFGAAARIEIAARGL